jgi:hypothetical protein
VADVSLFGNSGSQIHSGLSTRMLKVYICRSTACPSRTLKTDVWGLCGASLWMDAYPKQRNQNITINYVTLACVQQHRYTAQRHLPCTLPRWVSSRNWLRSHRRPWRSNQVRATFVSPRMYQALDVSALALQPCSAHTSTADARHSAGVPY